MARHAEQVVTALCEQARISERAAEKTGEERDGRPEYRKLKEGMKADFKQIRKAVRKRRPLDVELVRALCSDARLMTTYAAKGDEYYTVFRERVESLAAAAKRGVARRGSAIQERVGVSWGHT